MVDYTMATGVGGLMMVRDLNPTVELWVKAGDVTTYGRIGFLWDSNITNGGGLGYIEYPAGGQWLLVKSLNLPDEQNFSFILSATNTSGLGGRTQLWCPILRNLVTPPSRMYLYPIECTSVGLDIDGPFTSGATGSSGVTTYYFSLDPRSIEWEIGYGTDPNTPQLSVPFKYYEGIHGLAPATMYYFWARGRNILGWGQYSQRFSARTLANARFKADGIWKEAVPYAKINGVWKPVQPYIKVAGRWRKSG